MDSTRREIGGSIAATLAAGGASVIWDAWQPYAGGSLLVIAAAVLVWSWWPSIVSGRVPKSLVTFGGVATLALLLAAAWKIGKDAGYSEAQRIARESLGAATVAQKDHDFAPGDAVTLGPDGLWRKAIASLEGRTAGAVVGHTEGDELRLVRSGFIAIRHSLGRPGDPIYLDGEIPGGLTTTTPTEGVGQPLGVVAGSNLLLIDVGQAWDLSVIQFTPPADPPPPIPGS